MKLTPKQKLFVDEYLVDLNATRAYKVSYPNIKKDETAAAAGARLLRNVKVESYVNQRMKEREKRTEITQDKVLKELAKIGFANATDFARVVERSYMKPILDAEGNKAGEEEVFYKAVEIFETKEISQDKLGAIASIKQGPNGIEVKPNDKVKALELIGRHLGMFTDKVDLTIETSEKFADIIEQVGGEGLDEEE